MSGTTVEVISAHRYLVQFLWIIGEVAVVLLVFKLLFSCMGVVTSCLGDRMSEILYTVTGLIVVLVAVFVFTVLL